ncbi:TPA: hypothetical protein NJY08_005051 [Salmonella enterica subsp. enterica serovar Typhi str. AG3]|nr:hypothetical protein [Salmonella enterica subsp. enterica serovar Typhi str. AG3]
MKVQVTCSLCNHFDSNRSVCGLHNSSTFAESSEAKECQENGQFLRDLNVQYSYYHFKDESGNVAANYIEDLTKLPKDEKGIPLFVYTKKGIERAVPAYMGLKLRSDFLQGVKREFTYQGQREIIYELGVELAKKRCADFDVELIVLEEERDSEGFEEYQLPYRIWR